MLLTKENTHRRGGVTDAAPRHRIRVPGSADVELEDANQRLQRSALHLRSVLERPRHVGVRVALRNEAWPHREVEL